jgi:uncharacterized protein (TIGR01777 family)
MTNQVQSSSTPRRTAQLLRVVLAGGSGHLGAVLQRHFHSQGYAVTVLSRRPVAALGKVVLWDGRTLGNWRDELDGADVLVNLCGRSVNCRSTSENRQEIMESRILPTQILGQALQDVKNPPKLWLNASTAAIYRHSIDRAMDEVSGEVGGNEPDVPRSWDFSVEVGKRWEETFFAADVSATRRIALRSAVVMSPDRGGIFDVLLRLVRFGLGGTVDDGKQFVSWIHEADFVRAIDHLIARELIFGVVNACSPNPVPNAEFMRALRNAWGTRIGLPASRPILKIGTFLMRTESELVLKSRRAVPRRLLEDGFRFIFTDWSGAAKELVGRWRSSGEANYTQESWNVSQGTRIHERPN